MAPYNRYTPKFKADAVAAFIRRRADYPREKRTSSLRFIASELNVPESTFGNWVQGVIEKPAGVASGPILEGTQEKRTEATSTPIVVHIPEQPRRGRGLDWLALLVSLVAIVWPQIGLNIQHTREQQKNAQSFFEVVSGPNPPSYEALALKYAAALNYTEQNSPVARLLTLVSESSRVMQRANVRVNSTKGSTVTRVDDVYRICAIDDSNDCESYHSLEFDEQNRLRSYSFKDNRRLDSMLLSKEEGSSENEDSKVSLIEGAETPEGKVLFVAQVTNKRADELVTIDFAGAKYAAGGQRRPAEEVMGPSTLGPNESVTIAGFVGHARGITLSLPVIFQSEDGKSPPRSSVLLIKLF